MSRSEQIAIETLERIAAGFDRPIDDQGTVLHVPLPAAEAQQMAAFALLAIRGTPTLRAKLAQEEA